MSYNTKQHSNRLETQMHFRALPTSIPYTFTCNFGREKEFQIPVTLLSMIKLSTLLLFLKMALLRI